MPPTPAAVGGWKKTTSNALTGTKQNAADTSTTPTTITATVDAVNIFGQTVSHTDLGGRVYTYTYTYTYNLAGWLTAQSSTAGQSIGYEYYANGYIKKTVDNVTGRLHRVRHQRHHHLHVLRLRMVGQRQTKPHHHRGLQPRTRRVHRQVGQGRLALHL